METMAIMAIFSHVVYCLLVMGKKTGINEHPEICRDFVFAHRNEHVCPSARARIFSGTGTHVYCLFPHANTKF